MKKIRISAVSYTNTKPFTYGLRMHPQVLEKIELSLDVPAVCAQKLISGQVDIGLVPVAVIPEVPHAQIVSEFCIGAKGRVNSVFIFSKKPASDIRSLHLDPESRTSNMLAQVLLNEHWKADFHLAADAASADAQVLIGDRTFRKPADFPFSYDLAEEWLDFTGKPFVFAAWVANKPIPEDFLQEFNLALAYGVDHRLESITDELTDFDLKDYILNRLDYRLDKKKEQALDLFLDLIKKV